MSYQEILDTYRSKSLEREGIFYYWLQDQLWDRFKKFRSYIEIIGDVHDVDIILFVHEVSHIMKSLDDMTFIINVNMYTSNSYPDMESYTSYYITDPGAIRLFADIDYRLNNYMYQSID